MRHYIYYTHSFVGINIPSNELVTLHIKRFLDHHEKRLPRFDRVPPVETLDLVEFIQFAQSYCRLISTTTRQFDKHLDVIRRLVHHTRQKRSQHFSISCCKSPNYSLFENSCMIQTLDLSPQRADEKVAVAFPRFISKLNRRCHRHRRMDGSIQTSTKDPTRISYDSTRLFANSAALSTMVYLT